MAQQMLSQSSAQLPATYFKQPLSKQFFGLLIKLEEKVGAKIISPDEVSKLTEMYGQLVSYYDALMDPIKHYFMEKIQMVLVYIQQEKTSKLLETPSRKTSSIFDQSRKMSRKKTKDMRARSLSKSSNSDPDEDEAKDMVDSLPGGNEEEQEIREKNVSISEIRKSRQKKMSLLLQVNKAQESSNEQNELLGNYDNSTNKNDQNVKKQLKEQSSQLQKRLEDRKKNRQNRKQGSQNEEDSIQ